MARAANSQLVRFDAGLRKNLVLPEIIADRLRLLHSEHRVSGDYDAMFGMVPIVSRMERITIVFTSNPDGA